MNAGGAKQSFYNTLPLPVRIGVTFLLMLFSWVLFRAESLTAAVHYYAAMFGLAPGSAAASLLAAEIYTPLSMVVMIVCAGLVFQRVQAHEWSLRPQGWGRVAFLVPMFVFSLLIMFSQAFNPFLYFQF